jgi:hypothetical protein
MPDREKAMQIIGLAQDIAQHASDLANHQSASCCTAGESPQESPKSEDPIFFKEELVKKCQKIYALRRDRDQIFGKAGMFCDPAWDILLDLFMGHLRGDRISVTSVGIAACAPITTALRWLAILEKDGLVSREHDPADGRRMFVSLTDPAIANMTRILEDF